MNGWIDITIDDQDRTQVMLVPGGMLVVHTVRSAIGPTHREDNHYRPTMMLVPCAEIEARMWIDEQLHLREKAGAR